MISIIMPVFNEAAILQSTLDSLSLSENEELIIVDGGSTDNSAEIARLYTDNFFTTLSGRASVMNYGTEQASGTILLFLHADCILPERAYSLIRTTLAKSSVAAGGFYLGIKHTGRFYRLVEFMANIRAQLTGMIYGDQGMFLRKTTFEDIGGFANIPLMEDIEISRKLRKKGEIVFISPSISASPRRWLKEGPIYTTLRDWVIAFLYSFIKVDPAKLIRHYRDTR